MYGTFHGKILLFGEYTIITGSKALVTPLRAFSGRFVLPEEAGDSMPGTSGADRERRDLEYFADYISRESAFSLAAEKMRGLLDRGLFFQSSIPRGYGAGSSAALVAAVYEAFVSNRYARETEEPEELANLRRIFEHMESFFHGTSSGIDPVCSYTDRTLLVDGHSIQLAEIPVFPADIRMFLLDAGMPGETAPLVKNYRQRLADEPLFARIMEQEVASLVDSCIRQILGGSLSGFADSLKKLSEYQLKYFRALIPAGIRKSWEAGHEDNLFTLKLCGSGGGGYFLGYTERWGQTEQYFRRAGEKIHALGL